MAKSKKDDIAQEVAALRADGIEFLRFELPDLHGISRSKLVPLDAVEGYARKGLNMYGGILALDTASNVISGTGLNEEINYADSKLFPDFSTLRRVPWKQNTAKVICDVAFQDNSPNKAAPRYVLRNLLETAAELGFDVMMGHEYEFYLLTARPRSRFSAASISSTRRATPMSAPSRPSCATCWASASMSSPTTANTRPPSSRSTMAPPSASRPPTRPSPSATR